jgi:PAS domain S-box-containing protein
LNLANQKMFLAPRFYELTGYFPGEVVPNLDFVKSTVHPEDWSRAIQNNMAYLQQKGGNEVCEFDYRLITRWGEIKWMECRARVVEWDQQGAPLRMVGVITDIGARKLAEKALQESEAFAKGVLNSVASHIAVVDRNGFILAINAPWERFAQDNSNKPGKMPPQTGIGANYLEICRRGSDARDGAKDAGDGIQAVLAGNIESFSMEYPCHSPNEYRWFSMYTTPLDTGGKSPGSQGAVVVHTDITARKNMEIERKRANAMASRLAVFAATAINYALVMLNSEGHVVEWSHGAHHLTQISRKQALGRQFSSLFTQPSIDASIPQTLLDKALRMEHVAVEERIVRADNSSFVGSGTLYWLADGNEGAHFALILSDVTASQQAALQVVESEARLSAVIAAASDAIVSTNAEGVVQLFNPAAERIFQVPVAEMIGQTLERLIPGARRLDHGRAIQGFVNAGIAQRTMGAGRVEALRADGQKIELEASISKAQIGGSVVLTAILRDVTERTRADRALAQYQEELAGLTHRLLQQEKETTQKLAQALHDELGQTLAALRLIFDAENRAHIQDAGLKPWGEKMERLIEEANRQARQVLTDLRPPLLDELGLQAALDNELRKREANHEMVGFQMTWDTGQAHIRWPSQVEYSAFIVAREAINNALLHADPQTVSVTVQGHQNQLHVSVHDDGHGIADLASLDRSGHLGLIGMRERAVAIGATLDIHSSPGHGTAIQLHWSPSA